MPKFYIEAERTEYYTAEIIAENEDEAKESFEKDFWMAVPDSETLEVDVYPEEEDEDA